MKVQGQRHPKIIREPGWTFKLLPDALKQLKIEPEGIIHVGAHWGQEVPVYLELGFDPIVLIEPDPAACDKITSQDWWDPNRIELLQLAIASEVGFMDFYRVTAGNGVWNGLKRNHGRPDPEEVIQVRTMPLDRAQATRSASVLVIDTQGTELQALQTANLSGVELVIIETQIDGVDGVHPEELNWWASDHDWEVAIVWDRTGGWTDTLLVPRR